MPRLWTETIETHRREVRATILDATWELVAEHGLLSVTMSQVAERVGIGRATLYKYFPDVEAILLARHEQHISGHLTRLAELRDRAGDPEDRLTAVLEALAFIRYHRERHGTAELSALLHKDEHVAHAEQQLIELIRGLLDDAAASGQIRDDVATDELARYCLHSLTAAAELESEAAVQRLVSVTMAGMRPPN